MKVWIDGDEWYPVYTLHRQQHSDEATVEIDSIFYERYEKALKEFQAVQKELRELL
jgi:hypothetical protein